MSQSHNDHKVRVGISVGDINGVGMEIIIRTLADNRILQDIVPVVYGNSKLASYYKKALNLPEFNFHSIQNASDAVRNKANLVNCWNDEVTFTPGEANSTGGKYAFISLEAAVKDLAGGKLDVLVTAPINKEVMQSDQFRFPGHTEYLASIAGVDEALMMMVAGDLRVGVLTGHIPLNQVSSQITKDRLQAVVKRMNQSLIRDFGIRRPRIAVLGLNPHAGENGLLGEEDKNIITPAIQSLRNEQLMVFGPYPADGFFGSGNFRNFDGVLAMYHDQGLAPFKSISFNEGVNFTAGLPVVRTSPDHGTAYDLAGKGTADETSFRNAIYLAKDVFLQRRFHKEITANPLQAQVRSERSERE
ncbi:MAG TPA: 4-hydroxythreonine-4-phosphate dehydrogenase PdxA [Flavobacteriales bacterium]|nr:4-hydroxythreonine-4-phosphate dehydrogenase PdxA [Flavobacteriales bacterium]HCA82941.1 4-hydroxythreonine-4-phosphate dehydrogenase PdxA [Flavobacteriales bacterium]HRE73860.1 4-hydroxythreonine-4-phosphate dehydrogenase PdxA [Flavobacteriales bacterium]HRE98283.1 4-hydroxythreonine-4-phosphate dehydrogenase PdxA [Flavobacteriales bacterium]HRJ34517.1 4-hydroxythreonine-4-phosphate dehydrogenase PdxA [Flavobacteriales bacterium]